MVCGWLCQRSPGDFGKARVPCCRVCDWLCQRTSGDFSKARSLLPCVSWLGRQDSNLRMAVPKTAALPLGDSPSLVVRAGIEPAASRLSGARSPAELSDSKCMVCGWLCQRTSGDFSKARNLTTVMCCGRGGGARTHDLRFWRPPL